MSFYFLLFFSPSLFFCLYFHLAFSSLFFFPCASFTSSDGAECGSSPGSSAPGTGPDTEGQSTRHGNHGLTFQLSHPVTSPKQK